MSKLTLLELAKQIVMAASALDKSPLAKEFESLSNLRLDPALSESFIVCVENLNTNLVKLSKDLSPEQLRAVENFIKFARNQ